jgi:hypothetical protein
VRWNPPENNALVCGYRVRDGVVNGS